jgi:hypothetical protein
MPPLPSAITQLVNPLVYILRHADLSIIMEVYSQASHPQLRLARR